MQRLLKFLKKYHDGKSPLLLALSGGNDSLALLALLRRAQSIYPFVLHVAHVDHGWRQESAAQAEQLRQWVSEPFFLKRLEGLEPKEEVARTARLAFFRQLQQEGGYQAVLLAHHADDQAETVLKRVFEGAHLAKMGGMQEVAEVEGVVCWRPLLGRSKKELEVVREHAPLEDCTNQDRRYLRSRMRGELLPLLETSFGKSVGQPLALLGRRAAELNCYLSWRLESYRERVLRGPWGVALDFSGLAQEAALEWEWLIKQELGEVAKIREMVEALVEGRVASFGEIWVDRRRLFQLKKRGEWQVSHEPFERGVMGWQQLWRGELALLVPEGYRLEEAKPSMKLSWTTKTLGAWWSQQKVPLALRYAAPVVCWQGQVWAEFLSGREACGGTVHLQLKMLQ